MSAALRCSSRSNRSFILQNMACFRLDGKCLRGRRGQVNNSVGLGGGVGVALGDSGAVEFGVVPERADAGDAEGFSEDAPATRVDVAEPSRTIADAVGAGEIRGKIFEADDLFLVIAQ